MTLPGAVEFLGRELEGGRQHRRVRLALGDAAATSCSILRDEVEALVAEGVDYIQLDAPFYGVFIDEQHRATLRHAGVDPDRALARGGRRRQRGGRRSGARRA